MGKASFAGLSFYLFFIYVSAIPIQYDGVTSNNALEGMDETSTMSNTLACQDQLSSQIEQCLFKFESRFRRYNGKDVSEDSKKSMESQLCQEYEQGLMCLHYALQDCPPTEFHLQMMGARLGHGHVRDIMEVVCERNDGRKSDPTTTSQPTVTDELKFSTTTSTQAPTSTVSTFYEVKILDNLKQFRHSELHPRASLKMVNMDTSVESVPKDINIGLTRDKSRMKIRQWKLADENNILDKKHLQDSNLLEQKDTGDIPVMKPLTLNCDKDQTNPACQAFMFNSASQVSLDWLLVLGLSVKLTVLVTFNNLLH